MSHYTYPHNLQHGSAGGSYPHTVHPPPPVSGGYTTSGLQQQYGGRMLPAPRQPGLPTTQVLMQHVYMIVLHMYYICTVYIHVVYLPYSRNYFEMPIFHTCNLYIHVYVM